MPEGDPSAILHYVLVVDDEVDIQESMRDMIETCIEGTEVIAVGSAEEGLVVLADRRVDLIITDYRMGGMDGLDFLIEAQRRAPQVPRIMITAYPDIDLVLRAIGEGRITNFLPKPFRGGKVLDAVKEALAQRQHELERRQRLVSALHAMRRESRVSAPPEGRA